MPRVIRYVASPLQEIFLPEKTPFVIYDRSTSESEPPKPSGTKFTACMDLKKKYDECLRQVGSGGLTADQLAEASNNYRQCISGFALEVNSDWSELRSQLGPSKVNFTKLAVKDARIDECKYGKAPSLVSKYGLAL